MIDYIIIGLLVIIIILVIILLVRGNNNLIYFRIGDVMSIKIERLNSNFVKPERSSIYPGYVIIKGQISEDVRKVQARLIELGYNCGKCGADSIFGKDTLEAVIAFQKDNKLDPDGKVGPLTWGKLF